jgi:hypothetical protein
MKSKKIMRQPLDATSDLSSRMALVMSVHDSHGYVNRKVLIETYGITQIQAGSMIRDFLHTNASRVKWDVEHAKYWLDERKDDL